MPSSPPSNSSSSPPPSDSSPPPPPSDSSSSSSSPPPPSDLSSSSSSSPPPSNSSSNSSSSSSPPPTSHSSSSSSPPPASDSGSDSSPPSPPPPSSSPPPPSSDNSQSSPPPRSSSSDSPPPPPPPNGNNDGGSPPPPPPPPHRSGSSNDNSHNAPPPPSSLPSSSSGSLNDNQEKGIIAGASVLLLIMIVFFVYCCRRKKRRRPHNHMQYFSESQANLGGNYYTMPSTGNWSNSAPPSNNTGLAKPPPPPPSANVSSEQNWIAPPPPPPPMMNSSDMSSMGFSGPHQAALPPPHPAMALGFNQSSFTYNDLAAATSNFAPGNLLGQGGFGFVHKGVLPNGKEIAVKSLKANSGQGEREFQAEVDIISRVHHRHLVSLVGYCIAGSQRMLVYEFIPNKTLEYHLHGAGPAMDWPTRLKIALGSAKGFAYLHEDCNPRIIHRDIKAANILLDCSFEAKVADFGLAKLSNDTNTHVSTRIMGTFGYLAPEYASSGKLTEKSDVYSYGIMLLELITGRRPVDVSRDDDDDTLVDWARLILIKVIEGESYEQLVDPKLEQNYDPQEVLRMVSCAAACIRQSARRRPKMSQIVRALEGDASLDDLHDDIKPGQRTLKGSSGSSADYDYNRPKNRGLSSQEYASSEFGITGEFSPSSVGNSQEMSRRD